MKTIAIFMLVVVVCSNVISQTTGAGRGKAQTNRTSQRQAAPNVSPANMPVQPRETITEKYLRGPVRQGTGTTANTNATTSAAPFVDGIQAADNASRTFDNLAPNNPNSIDNRNSTNATVPGGNDTVFNVHSINQNGLTTNSGAVDRSGQSQFGQTNWGNGRSTVGESQWTVPPPITASFNRDFPTISNATWVRNNVDTSIYSARYKSGAEWTTINYTAAGQQIDTRTELPVIQPPRPVSVYLAKQPTNFRAVTISRVQMQGRPELYAIQTSAGKTIYINNEGMEVNY